MGPSGALSTDSDRPTPDYLALSLMPQPHDAMGAGVGWQALRSVWIPTGPALRTTRRGHHHLELPESMHKAHRYGMETTTLRRLLPVDAHSARPGTTTLKGAGSKRRDTSAPCCSPDGPALGGALLVPSLISQVPLSE